MRQRPNMPRLATRRLAHLALAAALAAMIGAPDLAMAQASPFLTGASSLQTNARTAREYLVALPPELSPQARINLVRGFSRELVERYRFALDIAIHAPRDFPGSDPRNFHAHLLATTREVTREGLGAKTALEWSDAVRRQHGLGAAVGELLHVRERWAVAANTALEHAQVAARIDHRTLEAQGIDREPKHIPYAALDMERRGYYSVVAERIRAEHQARVEARLARAGQHEQSVAAPKHSEDTAKESAERWAQQRQAQKEAHPKEQEDTAKESVQKWLQYRQAQTEAQAQGREQTDPALASTKRARDHDLSR